MKPLIFTKSEKPRTVIPVSRLASRKAPVATAAIAMAVALFAPALPPALADPITASSPEDIVGPGNYFQSTVALNANSLTGTNHIFTHVKFRGYTGAVVFLLDDAQGRVIAATDPLAYGVDGQAIPFKSSNRNERFNIPVAPNIAAKTKSITIVHMPAPHNRLAEDMPWIIDVGKAIYEIVKVLLANGQTDLPASEAGGTPPPVPPTVDAMVARLNRIAPAQVSTFHAGTGDGRQHRISPAPPLKK